MLYKLTSTRVHRAYYGGEHIDSITGIKSRGKTRYPEDWLASVTEAFNPDCKVDGEGLSKTEDGRYLRDIIHDDKVDMIGNDKEMKLLFKMLDSAERLVIQGHPTVEFAKKYFKSDFGKTECWYILNDGGSVYLGFKPGITKEYWKHLFEEQDIEGMLECLHEFKVHPGDMIFVEGGVPHAIGANCFVAELQEPTDLMVITERITPSGVVLAEGKLHGGLGFERMFDCFCYDGLEREEIKSRYFLKAKKLEEGRNLLVGSDTTDKFRLEEITVEKANLYETENYGIVLVTSGSGCINNQSVTTGERFFVPYSEKELKCSGNMTFLLCSAV
jgi:mannose-6-phosphate isomerase